MIYLQLFLTFFQIGLFGFGGGYGMLSLIQNQTVYNHAWLTAPEFTNIVAISQMTPGPISINAATYCGYTAIHKAGMGEWASILGSATATCALVLPSFILMILICRVFMKYMNTPTVQNIMSGLRPAVVGLIAAAATSAYDPRELLVASYQPVELLGEHRHLRGNIRRHEVREDKPDEDDKLGCVRRTHAAILTLN